MTPNQRNGGKYHYSQLCHQLVIVFPYKAVRDVQCLLQFPEQINPFSQSALTPSVTAS